MNYLSVKTVLDIIALAEVCYPTSGQHQSVSLSDAIDMALLNNPAEQALYQSIDSLPSEQLAELQALMLIGRDTSEKAHENWGALHSDAISSEHSASVGYITGKVQLAEYLRNGLAKLGL
ncbi:TPA: DUF3775 domain-containing protein [Photobacterium damselae]